MLSVTLKKYVLYLKLFLLQLRIVTYKDLMIRALKECYPKQVKELFAFLY